MGWSCTEELEQWGDRGLVSAAQLTQQGCAFSGNQKAKHQITFCTSTLQRGTASLPGLMTHI